MNKNIVIGMIIIVALAAGVGIYLSQRPDRNPETSQQPNQQLNTQQDEESEFEFQNPKKSAHYETNTPNHGTILAAPPINIVIDFNFDLAPPSAISVMRDGKEYATDSTVIDNNKLSMRRNFDSTAPDGLYRVSYNACWPDRTCHDGNFDFAIDRSLASEFRDLRNQKEVTIRMSEIKFLPQNIRISPNTKLTWINDDEIEHYVNTDSHPAHTYFLQQNSRALKKGESYQVTFIQAGIYPYHCSAHASNMIGNILVD